MKIIVEPRGYEIELQPATPIMSSARAQGYWWPTICGGHAECGACVMQIIEGADCLIPANAMETAMLTSLGDRYSGNPAGDIRLACQAVPVGDLRVRKVGVRPLPAKSAQQSDQAPDQTDPAVYGPAQHLSTEGRPIS